MANVKVNVIEREHKPRQTYLQYVEERLAVERKIKPTSFIRSTNKLFKTADKKVPSVKLSRNLGVQETITREQNTLRELFNGEPTFGTGRNLPKIKHKGGALNPNDGQTARMFGL